MATETIEQGEVSLFGTRYKLAGPVQEQSLPNFAPKQLFGDPSRQDQVMVGQWIMSDWRDGMGVYDYAERDNTSSFYDSGAETRLRGQLRLPRRQYVSTQLADTPICMDTWGTLDYVAAGSIVYQQNASTAFVAFGTAPYTITDMQVYKDSLYVGAGTAGYMYRTSGGTAFTTVSAATAYYFAEHDAKLLCLSASGSLAQLKWTTSATAGTADWTTHATLTDVATDVQGIDTYLNTQGADAPYVFTRWGVRVIDFATQTIYKPRGLQFGDGDSNNALAFTASYGGGEGFLAVRSAIYRITGQNVTQLLLGQEVNSGGPITSLHLPMGAQGGGGETAQYGPSRRGIVHALTATDRYIIAAVQAQDSDAGGVSGLVAWNGRGFHSIASWSNDFGPVQLLHYSRATSLGKALWYNRDFKMYYVKQPDVSDDPWLYEETQVEITGATHITGWFDADFSEIDKTALELSLRKRGAGGTIVTSYGLDYDDSTWNAMATITATGATAIPFNSQVGTAFRAIRFKYGLSTSASTVDAVMDYASLKYALSPDILRGWRMTLDCSGEYGGKSAAELLSALKTAQDTKTLGVLSFRPNDDHYVRVMQVAGKELTGQFAEGRYDVLVAQLV